MKRDAEQSLPSPANAIATTPTPDLPGAHGALDLWGSGAAAVPVTNMMHPAGASGLVTGATRPGHWTGWRAGLPVTSRCSAGTTKAGPFAY